MKTNRLFSLSLALIGSLYAQNSVSVGALSSPYPTLSNLSLDLPIVGDDNQTAIANLQFRVKGESSWQQGMDLRRIAPGTNLGFTWDNKFSGSIFNLTPNTEYEIKVDITDSDGGDASKTIFAKTRPVAEIPSNATIVDLPAGNYGEWSPPSGTPDKPIVYRSNGDAIYDYINMYGVHDVILWGLKVHSTGKYNQNAIKMNNSENIVVRFCEIKAEYGIVSYLNGTKNSYFADNTIIGTTGWTESTMGAQGDNSGEGIQITGPGNVIAYNKITGFRDNISLMEGSDANNQVSIDIYNNDLDIGADDAIEADFCAGNCRIYDNQINNSYVGLSSQPSLGGPTYFIRNTMYNVVHAAFKLKRNSVGDVVLHNTVVKIGAGLAGNDDMDYAYFRNNLAFGGPTGGINWGGYGAGNPYAADIKNPGDHSSFDYDGVGSLDDTYIAKIGGINFSTVESNGLGSLDFASTFNNVSFPYNPVPIKSMPDLHPKSGSDVIDQALIIPNINDGFKGTAPDIGALEFGAPKPHYGPRLQGQNESNFPNGDSITLIKPTSHIQEASGFIINNTHSQVIVHYFDIKGTHKLSQRLEPFQKIKVPNRLYKWTFEAVQ